MTTIEQALEALEHAIRAAPQLPYEQAYRLWREGERLTGLLEVHMFEAPDYPEFCDICHKSGATERPDGSVLCDACDAAVPIGSQDEDTR